MNPLAVQLIIMSVFGLITATIGSKKGRSGIGWFFVGFFTGLIGVIRSRERSILVYLAMIIGLCVLLFILGEIIFPH